MQNTTTDIKQILDQHVKALHTLLREMDPQSRSNYIKDMLPYLLTFSTSNNITAQQKLQNNCKNPLQNLSTDELDVINELAAKTEKLYKSMNGNGYFG